MTETSNYTVTITCQYKRAGRKIADAERTARIWGVESGDAAIDELLIQMSSEGLLEDWQPVRADAWPF